MSHENDYESPDMVGWSMQLSTGMVEEASNIFLLFDLFRGCRGLSLLVKDVNIDIGLFRAASVRNSLDETACVMGFLSHD